MSHSYIHAENSVKLFGGKPEDYVEIHSWFDASKAWCPDWRHRAMRHHLEGIKECIKIFGEEIINSNGQRVNVYDIGIQHQIEDFGFVPTAKDWFDHFDETSWEKFRDEKIKKRLELPRIIQEKKPSSIRELIKSL